MNAHEKLGKGVSLKTCHEIRCGQDNGQRLKSSLVKIHNLGDKKSTILYSSTDSQMPKLLPFFLFN